MYEGYNDNNIHILASSYLREEAGRFYDGLTNEPNTFTEFKEIMIKKYRYMPKDRPTLLRNVLNRVQEEQENLSDFANVVYKMGLAAGMDEVLIIQTIISNLRCKEKQIIRLFSKNINDFKDLLSVLENVETDDVNTRNNIDDKHENRYSNDNKFNDLIDRIDNLTLTVNNRNVEKTRVKNVNIKCYNCGNTGHVSKFCTRNNRSRASFKQRDDLSKIINDCSRYFGGRLPERMLEFLKKIKNTNSELSGILKNIPGHFLVEETLKRNPEFRREIEKFLTENPQINSVEDENCKHDEYEILKCKVIIYNVGINSVIDTGASTSVISYNL